MYILCSDLRLEAVISRLQCKRSNNDLIVADLLRDPAIKSLLLGQHRVGRTWTTYEDWPNYWRKWYRARLHQNSSIGCTLVRCAQRRDPFCWPPPIWRQHLFCKCCFFQSIPSTPLKRSLRNFNTWRVSVGNKTSRSTFWVSAPKTFCAQKLPIFDDFATQWQIWVRVSPAWNLVETIKKRRWKLRRVLCESASSQNFVNFGPLTAKNRTGVFTYSPKIMRFLHCR